ncbi:hypothetical protein GCM10029978_089600 [Actinoallomurus acanthiterrae]
MTTSGGHRHPEIAYGWGEIERSQAGGVTGRPYAAGSVRGCGRRSGWSLVRDVAGRPYATGDRASAWDAGEGGGRVRACGVVGGLRVIAGPGTSYVAGEHAPGLGMPGAREGERGRGHGAIAERS